MRDSDSQSFVVSVKAPLLLRELGVIKKLEITKRRIMVIENKHSDLPVSVLEELPLLLSDPQAVYVRGLGKGDGEANVVIEVSTAKNESILVGINNGEIKTITPKHHSENLSGPASLVRYFQWPTPVRQKRKSPDQNQGFRSRAWTTTIV